MHYTVIAYRWGWANAHQYQYACTAELERACELAEEENSDRGGKYGLAVYAWSGETTCELVRYWPSAWAEEGPHFNERIEMFEGIGHDVHELVTTGLRWVAGAKPHGPRRPVAEHAPEWAVESVRTRETTCRFMAAVRDDIHARRKSGTAPLEGPERQAWLSALSATIDAEVDELLARVARHQAQMLAAHGQCQGPEPAGEGTHESSQALVEAEGRS